jgi:predicted enzyme related to lactoylglutathione lyase
MEKTMSEQNKREDVVVWFEIPAADFARASGFYEKIFATTLQHTDYQGRAMGVFPYEITNVGGCVMEEKNHVASGSGTLIYLNCDGRLDDVAARVEGAGGRLLTPRIDLPNDRGSMLHISDSEGNRIGLHAVA